MGQELLGSPIRKELLAKLKARVEEKPSFIAHLIYNPSSYESYSYICLIEKALNKLGIEYVKKEVKEYEEAYEAIKVANEDDRAMIFLARPLKIVDESLLIEMIDPNKDADMLTSSSLGKLVKGDLKYLSGTSSAVNKLLDYYSIDCTGKKALIVGRSISVGLPISLMMLKRNALVKIVHSRISKEEIDNEASQSDIVILCAGQRGLVKTLKEDAILIDCGYQDDGKGDLGFVPTCSYTPVPGGVGPITILALIENAYYLYDNK